MHEIEIPRVLSIPDSCSRSRALQDLHHSNAMDCHGMLWSDITLLRTLEATCAASMIKNRRVPQNSNSCSSSMAPPLNLTSQKSYGMLPWRSMEDGELWLSHWDAHAENATICQVWHLGTFARFSRSSLRNFWVAESVSLFPSLGSASELSSSSSFGLSPLA